MKYRLLGKTGFKVSEVSLGTWQLGGTWGSEFDDRNADAILSAAVDAGVNFIDTADVYSNGLSEQAVGRFVKKHDGRLFVATKCGRQLNPHTSEAYTPTALRAFVEASLKRMGLECLDLVQLHCPPTAVYYRPEIFGLFDQLKQEGKILNLGVSVEKVEEALKAIEFPNVTTVQIIFNMFRHRPAELFFDQAKQKNVGIIVRVPLASGLLTGKFSASSTFDKGDHRNFNRDGAGFDKGETFSGVPYDIGLQAVDKLKTVFAGEDLAQNALRWVLMFDQVSTVIPGASKPEQVVRNLTLAKPLSGSRLKKVKDIYDQDIRPLVHQLW